MSAVIGRPLITELEHDVPYQVALTGETLVSILRDAGYEIPITADVEFDVPGGGDYSNCTLDVSRDYPLYIRWKVRKTFRPES